MKRIMQLCTALLALGLALPLQAQSLTKGQIQIMEQGFETLFEQHDLVGVQAAIYDSGNIVSQINLGYADLEHKVPVIDNTRFELASITKAFTGLALHQLVEAGKIELNDDVRQYVPEFPKKPEGTITINQLAGSLSGIRHYGDERDPAFYATHYDDVIDALALFKDDPLVHPPGTKEHYTSYGYNLLAAALQRASGVKFQDYVQTEILDPLGLRNTGFIDVRIPLANRSRTYIFVDVYSRETLDRLQNVPTLEHSYNAGGGNMYSSATDLVNFGRQFLAPEFISEQILEQVYQPHYDASGKPTGFSDGWAIGALPIEDQHLVASGGYPGTASMLILLPEKRIVIAYVLNTWPKAWRDAQRPLLQTLLRAVGVTPKQAVQEQ